MEMPPIRKPNWKTVWRQSWFRLSSFMKEAFPLIVAGSLFIETLAYLGWLDLFGTVLSPITVYWLGLPAFTGILLLFGIARKEAALVLLGQVAGLNAGAPLSDAMTPLQMIVFSFIIMVYIPCVATIIALGKEVGWKKAVAVALIEIHGYCRWRGAL